MDRGDPAFAPPAWMGPSASPRRRQTPQRGGDRTPRAQSGLFPAAELAGSTRSRGSMGTQDASLSRAGRRAAGLGCRLGCDHRQRAGSSPATKVPTLQSFLPSPLPSSRCLLSGLGVSPPQLFPFSNYVVWPVVAHRSGPDQAGWTSARHSPGGLSFSPGRGPGAVGSGVLRGQPRGCGEQRAPATLSTGFGV